MTLFEREGGGTPVSEAGSPMSDAAGAERQFGEGPLSRAAARIYSLMVIEALLLLSGGPGLVPLILLDRDASNVPLAALCALPLGPALSAALYALHRHRSDLTDLKPALAFWRGYRMNVGGVLKIWLPALAALTVIGVNLANLRAARIPVWWAVLLVVIAVVLTLWLANALVITSLFAFRGRDVARLAAYFLTRTRRVTLGVFCLLVVAVAVTALASELVLALLGSLFALSLLQTSRPLIAEVRRDFTR
jgi:uncharacterized membrane protein YesL